MIAEKVHGVVSTQEWKAFGRVTSTAPLNCAAPRAD